MFLVLHFLQCELACNLDRLRVLANVLERHTLRYALLSRQVSTVRPNLLAVLLAILWLGYLFVYRDVLFEATAFVIRLLSN